MKTIKMYGVTIAYDGQIDYTVTFDNYNEFQKWVTKYIQEDWNEHSDDPFPETDDVDELIEAYQDANGYVRMMEYFSHDYEITSSFAMKVLEEEGYLPPMWCDEDIQHQAKADLDRELTPEELKKVIYYLSDGHDAEIGINWDVISDAIRAIVQ